MNIKITLYLVTNVKNERFSDGYLQLALWKLIKSRGIQFASLNIFV